MIPRVSVSIIVPIFNSEKYLIETLESVKIQIYNSWECLLIDDGSVDNSIDICNRYVKSDNRFLLFKRDREPKGASTCRNIGIENSNSKYVMFLDADDLLAEDCLSNRVNYMDEHSSLDFAVFQMKSFGNTEKLMTHYKEDYLSAFLRFDLPWAITCPLYKTSLLKNLSGFDEDYTRLQDVELHVRVILHTQNYIVIENSIEDCYYRNQKNDQEIGNLVLKKANGYYIFMNKMLENEKIPIGYLENLISILILYLMTIISYAGKNEVRLLNIIFFKAYKRRVISSFKLQLINFISFFISFSLLNCRKTLIYLIVFILDHKYLLDKQPLLKSLFR